MSNAFHVLGAHPPSLILFSLGLVNAHVPPLKQSMIPALRFPTALHREVADLAGDFFSSHAYVDTILVVNSCARGRAVAGSDLDMAVLITPTAPSQEVQSLTLKWQQFMATQPVVHRFRSTGRFTQVHVDVFDGRMTPTVWDDGGGPDSFEIEIGNRIAYAEPLREVGACFRQLQSQWLPYYGEELRLRRLAMVREACARDLEAIPFFLGRGLYFQAFDRLYKAFQEFLQALFVARRTYPLAYNKWIREQVAEWLSLPDLYEKLPPILSVRKIEGAELAQNADALRVLLERWRPNLALTEWRPHYATRQFGSHGSAAIGELIVRRLSNTRQQFQSKQVCRTKKSKGDKYAKDKEKYRILPWALGRWLLLQ